MTSFLPSLKTIALLVTLCNICSSLCYVYHGRLPKRHIAPCLSEPAEPPNRVIPADEETVKKLIERHKDEIQRYLDPMGTGSVDQISNKELEETFGKPMTPANLAKKELEYDTPNPYELPNVDPTLKLPYFVNFEFPSLLRNPPQAENECDEPCSEVKDTEESTPTDISSTSTGTNELPLDQKESSHEDNTASTQNSTGPPSPKDSEGIPLDLSSKDPLRELMDRNPDYPEMEEKYGPKWYLPKQKSTLTPVELEDGWSILPCGRVFKHILQPSQLDEVDSAAPNDTSCVTLKFRLMEAKTNTKITDNEEAGGPMITAYMEDLQPILKKCLKAMNTGEQAEFIFHVSEMNPENVLIDELEDVSWIRLWVYLWESHNPNERWWGLGPQDAHLYPEKAEGGLSKRERLELETDQITEQIETELSTNPTSPLWSDVLEKMNSTQKESYVRHFDRQLEKIQRMKCAEFTGSRSFGENIKSSGQVHGYDVGHQVGGVSKLYTWRETPFMMYIAVPVIPGVRAEHVNLNLTSTHISLSIGGNTVIDDDLTGSVDLDTMATWAMTDSALEHQPLRDSDPRLQNATLELTRSDQYDDVSRRPAVLIFLKKTRTSVRIWGAPFVNI